MRYSEFARKKPHEFLLFTKNGKPELIDKEKDNTMRYKEFANALPAEPLLFPKQGKLHISDQDNYLDDDVFLDNLTVDELKKLLIRHFIEHKN
ncbi:MAG: hypothetical protein J0649_02950 [Methylococcales bacterium]|nr:hypothetical protein [Methylococcales bacterium]